jgi:hypothetical protein
MEAGLIFIALFYLGLTISALIGLYTRPRTRRSG